MLKVYVGAARFVDVITGFLEGAHHLAWFEICQLGGHALHSDFQLFGNRLLPGEMILGYLFTIFQE